MTVEERLRATLARRAEQVQPSNDAWDRIRARTEGAHRRPRPVMALAVVTAVLALVVAATWLLDQRPGQEVPVMTDEGTATTHEPTSTSTTEPADDDEPVVVTTIEGSPWRLVVGRWDGGACPQVHVAGDPFDPTFCGAYESELDRQPVALGFGGTDEAAPEPSVAYGIARPHIKRVRLELADGRAIEGSTIDHARFPDIRFFAVTLADEPGFNGIEAVVALDASGKEVGRIDTSGGDDV